jgi:acyl homoserine lactone synthase
MPGFKIANAHKPQNAFLMDSAHRLRFEVFFKELKWTAGLQIADNREYDEYDQPYAWYILHANANGEVDAMCRLIPTTEPYMIADHYAGFVETRPLPRQDDIWELSRFCVSLNGRIETSPRLLICLIAAAIEFGLKNGIGNYIALAEHRMLAPVIRYGGWDPNPLGPVKPTPNDESKVVLYTVSHEMLDSVRKKNGIEGPML